MKQVGVMSNAMFFASMFPKDAKNRGLEIKKAKVQYTVLNDLVYLNVEGRGRRLNKFKFLQLYDVKSGEIVQRYSDQHPVLNLIDAKYV